MRRKTPIESLLADTEVINEIEGRVVADEGALPRAEAFRIKPETIRRAVAERAVVAFETRPFTEAIVRQFGRPSLLVRNDTFEVPASGTWRARLLPNKSKLDRAIRSVGRVELSNHPDFDWVGTAWVIAENVVVTNRHVAMEFARRAGNGFAFARNPFGQTVGARVDFREEHQQSAAAFEVRVNKIIHVEKVGEADPDLALMELRSAQPLPPPVLLSRGEGRDGQLIAVIGYPARDDRNGADAMQQVFGDIFEVKRLAPGMIIESEAEPNVFTHDCSTLGGNSGSLVYDIEAGEALGLHFAGQFRQANFAVRAGVLLRTLRRLRIAVPVPGPSAPPAGDEPEAAEGPTAASLDGREGYQEDFLGTSAAHKVPLPKLSAANRQKVAPIIGKPSEHVLKYTHFSLVMNKARRMAMYTVANVDGTQLRHIPRGTDRWFFDPRVRRTQQVGDELYRNNDLDRGHLVRRLDPVWGGEAEEANEDTFFFTNATPQHKDLNQRTWNDLEEYILDNAGAHRLRVSVFTGPVFRDDDRVYRNVQLPQQFWKVVVMVTGGDTAAERKLSATAYLLSQTHLLSDIEAAGFTFGQFRTFQVPVKRIEELTGLDFGRLRNFDPFRPEERRRREARIASGEEVNRRGERLKPEEGFGFRQLDSLADIVL